MLSSRLTRYGVAVGAAALATAARFALSPILGESAVPYLLVIAVLPFVGFYAGLGPAVVTFVLGGAAVWYFVLPPSYGFVPLDPADAAGLMLYVVVGAICAAVGDVARRSQFRAEESGRVVRASEAELASLFNVTNVGMAQVDPVTRRFIRVNR
ncbi:MAG: DUF4118 domain-containing protein, partial [Lysobacterales bacterium]